MNPTMNTQIHQSAGGEEFKPGQVSAGSLAAPMPLQSIANGIKPNPEPLQSDQKEMEIRLKFAEETHQYVRDYIRQADQKAIFLFAGASSLLAYLNSLSITSQWISNPKIWGIVEVLSFVTTFSLIAGCAFCAGTVMPRLNGPKRGLIFFNAICEYQSATEYAGDAISRRLTQLCDEKYKHIFDLSSVCREKYKSLIWGFKLGLTGAFSTFALLVVK